MKYIKHILFFMFLNSFGTNYYVKNDGSDVASGLSDELAWATITKVNTITLEAGDSVLFKCGDTWREQSIEVDQSGSDGNYIVYSAYGAGDKPRILGSKLITTWTEIKTNIWQANTVCSDPWMVITASGTNCQVFFIETDESINWGFHRTYATTHANLVTNYDWTWNNDSLYIYFTTNPNTTLTGVEAPQQQYAAIVNKTTHYASFENLELAYLGGYGIRDAYGPVTCYGQKVINCHIHHIGRKGSNIAYGTYTYHSNAYYGYNDIHDCGRRSLSLAAVNFSPSMTVDSVVFENNHFWNGFHTTGIDITPSSNPAHTFTNLWIRNNYFEGDSSIFLRGGDREDLYYDDGLNSNHIFCANQNTGTGGKVENVWIYNNIFTFTAGKAVGVENIKNIYIYNNTFYKFNPTLANFQSMTYISEGAGTPGLTEIKNNIYYTNQIFSFNNNLSCIKLDAEWRDSLDVDYNLYFADNPNSPDGILIYEVSGNEFSMNEWATYKSTNGWDLNSPTPDTIHFANYPTNLSVDSISDAVDNGLSVSWITTDYYGNVRSATPTIGAIEYIITNEELSTGKYIMYNGFLLKYNNKFLK